MALCFIKRICSLFIVFRSTIEFRGAPFFWWITDLSKPDVLFNLPFNIPIYGSHVGLLPFVLGVSMFFSQRLSMATMDSKQKPMMYIMNGFFILIFNGFPSGLNLYYTVYNLLNYFQQLYLDVLTQMIVIMTPQPLKMMGHALVNKLMNVVYVVVVDQQKIITVMVIVL